MLLSMQDLPLEDVKPSGNRPVGFRICLNKQETPQQQWRPQTNEALGITNLPSAVYRPVLLPHKAAAPCAKNISSHAWWQRQVPVASEVGTSSPFKRVKRRTEGECENPPPTEGGRRRWNPSQHHSNSSSSVLWLRFCCLYKDTLRLQTTHTIWKLLDHKRTALDLNRNPREADVIGNSTDFPKAD